MPPSADESRISQQKAPPPSSPAPTAAEDAADLAALNSTLDRMRTFLPPDPYILTIPQDVEPRYHHAYQYQAMQWLHQTPFEWKEGEGMQNLTWVFHEHGRECFVLQSCGGGAEDGRSGKEDAVRSTVGTPRAGGAGSGAPKKKISLDAYKKSKSGAGTPGQVKGGGADGKAVTAEEKKANAAIKGPVERVKRETEEVLAAVQEVEEKERVGDGRVAVNDDRKERKRKREDDVEQHATAPKKSRNTSPPPPSPPRQKKLDHPRPSQRAERKPTAPPTPPSTIPDNDMAALPPKLSPPRPVQTTQHEANLPPKLSPLRAEDIPPRLSPTIPPNIATALKTRDSLKNSSSSDLSAPNSVSGGKKKSPMPRNGFKAGSESGSPAVRPSKPAAPASEPHKNRETGRSSLRVRTPEPAELSQGEEIAVGRALKARDRSAPGDGGNSRVDSRSGGVVKLKVPKRQRDAVRRILGMRPKAAATSSSGGRESGERRVDAERKRDGSEAEKKPAVDAVRRETGAKGVAQKIGPPSKGAAEKAGSNKPTAKGEKAAVNGPSGPKNSDDPAIVKPRDGGRPVESERQKTRGATQEDASPKTKSGKPAEMKRYEPPGKRRESADKRLPDKDNMRSNTSDQAPSRAQEKDSRPSKRKEATGADDVSPTAKRKKVPEPITKEPSTPTQPSTSPTLQRSQQATPSVRKDLLSASVSMAREPSAEGATPSSAKSSTPIANNPSATTSNQTLRAPSSQPPSSKTSFQQAWESTQKRLEKLGRELKHAATAHVNKAKLSSSSSPTHTHNNTTDQKLAAVKAIESLFAYFLAFTAADFSALAADPKQSPSIRNWQSLHGFFAFVKRTCETQPLLMGLACHLGVVYAGHILDLAATYGKGLPAGEMGELTAGLLRNAKEAERRLNCGRLIEVFSGSWEGRMKGGEVRLLEEEEKAGGELAGVFDKAGGYTLPFGVQMSPLRAARAGFVMLQEWMESEGVGYEMKVSMDGSTADP